MNLTDLNLMYTDIHTLPNSINQLTSLQSLNIYDCLITSLPESIGDLKNLTYLTLGFNKLAKLPDSFAQLELKTLCMSEKEAKLLPREITDQIQNSELKLIVDQGFDRTMRSDEIY